MKIHDQIMPVSVIGATVSASRARAGHLCRGDADGDGGDVVGALESPLPDPAQRALFREAATPEVPLGKCRFRL